MRKEAENHTGLREEQDITAIIGMSYEDSETRVAFQGSSWQQETSRHLLQQSNEWGRRQCHTHHSG